MNLRELRLAKNWGQRDLANYSGVSMRCISYLEQSRGVVPHYTTQKKLLHALHVPWERHREIWPNDGA